jgi:isopenicillin-N epimerase
MPSPLASHWNLDPRVTYLNHGSFGASPRKVLEAQAALRVRMESSPARFFWRELEHLLDEARVALARFVGARADDLAFVPNASSGVNAVLRSLVFSPGDEILVTSHAYNACRVTAEHVAQRSGARVVVVRLPYPEVTPEGVCAALMAAVTPRTRLALLEHVTSPTGLVLPIGRLVRDLAACGVDTLVDGAHAPGMVPLDLRALDAAYFVGHCHKWLCAPKGSAFIVVRPDRQQGLLPVVISHGANSTREDRSRFRLLFDWTGAVDPTGWLSVPVALAFLEQILPGGFSSVVEHNHALAMVAREQLAKALGAKVSVPEEMIGAMATVPLPPPAPGRGVTGHGRLDPLQNSLYDAGFEVSIVNWPGCGRLLRISAQLYNEPAEYVRLADTLVELLQGETR